MGNEGNNHYYLLNTKRVIRAPEGVLVVNIHVKLQQVNHLTTVMENIYWVVFAKLKYNYYLFLFISAILEIS